MEIDAKIEEVPNGKDLVVNITLTLEEMANLNFLLGLAMGTAKRENMTDLFWTATKMVNKINATHPDFHPYAVPEAYQ
jgi:hypothetical protein